MINKRYKWLITVVLVGLVGLVATSSLRFKITGTSPSLKNFPAFTTQLSVNFNRQLTDNGLKVSSSDNIVKSAKVNGKSLVISLSEGLEVNKSYEIDIVSIQDTKNEKLINKKLRFVTTNDFGGLPKSQQQKILTKQTPSPSKDTINYEGLDNLENNGLSSAQIDELKQAFFQFGQSQHKTLNLVRIPAQSVETPPSSFSISFSASIDGAQFSAKVGYTDISSLRLQLFNKDGSALFDSGVIASTDANGGARE
jgi:hypothetical protein